MTCQDKGDISAESWVRWSSNEASPMSLRFDRKTKTTDRKAKKTSYVLRFDPVDPAAFKTYCMSLGHNVKDDNGTTKDRVEVYIDTSKDMDNILQDITTLIKFNNIMR
jgi:hypothetical protein